MNVDGCCSDGRGGYGASRDECRILNVAVNDVFVVDRWML